MINITVKEKNSIIDEIVVSGHSGYSHRGTDIVCASVSSIVITTINALVRFNANIKYDEKDGFVSIKLLEHNNIVDVLILNMLELFKELEKDYKENVKINKEVSSC